MQDLPPELILYIQRILANSGELRAYVNMCKAFNWDIEMRYFERELEISRKVYQNYNESMIKLWERTGIDDGVPAYYLKKNLNNDTRLFKTMWALNICSGEFYDMIRSFRQHNTYVQYTYNILPDMRVMRKCRKKRWRPCNKCWKKYTKEIRKIDPNS
jgi:hypothetical protein